MKESTQLSKVLKESSLHCKKEKEEFGVNTFAELVSKLEKTNISNNWLIWHPSPSTLHILNPSLSQDQVQIKYYLKIDFHLNTKAFHHNVQIPISISKIDDVRKISVLIEEISKYYFDCIELAVKTATTQLSESISKLSEDTITSSKYPDLLSCLQFIHCQLENVLCPKTHRKYNIITTILSLKCELISPAAYRYLQSLECISLPHHSTLRRLSENIGLENDYISYLRNLTTGFNHQQRYVSLHKDEIHLKAEYTY